MKTIGYVTAAAIRFMTVKHGAEQFIKYVKQ